jgi:hypothetical protein
MSINHLRELKLRNPFRPFTLLLTSGGSVSVPHPDFISINPKDDDFVVWDQHGRFKLLDAKLVDRAIVSRRNGKS